MKVNMLRNEPRPATPEAPAEVTKATEPVQTEKTSWIIRGFSAFLGFITGNTIARIDMERHAPMTILVFVLLILYIGNSYVAENKMKRIVRLENSIKVMKNKYTNLCSTTTNGTRASQIAPRVYKLGLKPSMMPARKIDINTNAKNNGKRK